MDISKHKSSTGEVIPVKGEVIRTGSSFLLHYSSVAIKKIKSTNDEIRLVFMKWYIIILIMSEVNGYIDYNDRLG